MKRLFPVLGLSLIALLGASCGGGKSSSTSTAVSVTISPTTASVAGGATQQFTATVTGNTNTAVTWEVNGTIGGDAIAGTISTTGLYTAPTVLPSNVNVQVEAVSQADTTKSAAAAVTLTAPAVTITIAPTSATVAAGATQQFATTVSGNSNTAVTWTVNGIAGGNATLGTITSSGLYTAPLSPPREAITVTATAQANTAFSASAPITPQFANATLNGSYVFFASQFDNGSGSGASYRAGVFQADGAGHITSGVTDANGPSGPTANSGVTGTYNVGADGRGTATLSDGSGTHTFSFALTSSTRGQLIEFDSAAATSGFLRAQNQNAIASLSGAYVFSISGDSSGPVSSDGQLVFSSGSITGSIDTNTSGTVLQNIGVTGLYTLGGNGRATASLTNPGGTSQFAVYVVDSSTLVLADIDGSGSKAAGVAFAQTGSNFSNASLGSSVYLVSGVSSSKTGPYAQAGRFDTNAAGAFSNGLFDANNAGTVSSSAAFGSSASYSVASNGRATISTGTSNFVVWLASNQRGVVLEIDSNAVANGELFQQQAAFSGIVGAYAFAAGGQDAAGTTYGALDAQLVTTGFGVLSGTADINLLSASPKSQALAGSSLSIGTQGRGTGSLTGLNFTFYFISADQFVLLSSDANRVVSGGGERQCSDCTFQ